ncbi:hypothetical protein AWC38_SpisGene20108 [Stylophora pistillata]|uniref:HAT C-terminal dimerisation domain-containing protein n=1 Tax=Stylophora pistillata TaxID=50429 RepID=A0A2B4RH45_STYPI|nr:hypothetical protein AWC38_SpisGene20108 [Stylophora pistillata]
MSYCSYAIFNPARTPYRGQPGFLEYGSKDVEELVKHYSSSEEDCQQLKDEWRFFKYELIQWRNEIPDQIKLPTNSKDRPVITPTDWCLQQLLTTNSLSPCNLSLLAKVAEYIVSLPVSNAWPERGASALKLIKSRLRSTLKNDMLSCLMQIHVNGPEAVTEIVTLRDAEIQTDDVVATEPELTVDATGVEEEGQWVAKQLDLPDVDSDPDSDNSLDPDSDLE